MSERYVWNVCNIDFPAPAYSSVKEVSYSSSFGPNHTRLNPVVTDSYKAVMYDGSVIFKTADGAVHEGVSTNERYPCSKYPYVVFDNVNERYRLAYSDTGYWYRDDTSGSSSATYTLKLSADGTLVSSISFKCGYIKTSDCKAGSVIKNSSSSSAYYYKNNGIEGNYWYKYLGSDSIDPASVSVKGKPHAGEVVTVSVTPGSGKVYGGTVSYLYQYSVNNGPAWTDIETTAAASVAFVVPASAKTIRFRVRAKDDMGFTSTDYVTTASVEVERLNLWVGVGGKARKGTELYVGVSGKARKVTAAYVGVNGKARRFL